MEVTMKDVSEMNRYQTTTKHSKVQVLCIILVIYYVIGYIWYCDMSMMALLTFYMLNFSEGAYNTYQHFMSFLHIDMTQVVEILPQTRQGPTYST